MLNQNLLCENVVPDDSEKSSKFDFDVKNEGRFKTLKVLLSSDDTVEKDDEVIVSINSGEELPMDNREFVVINRSDIIMIK